MDSMTRTTIYTFSEAGTYAVSLTVTDARGNAETIGQTVDVDEAPVQNQPPIADFQVTPTAPVAGETIQFNGTASLDLDGQITSFAWDFDGDGEPDSASPISELSFGSAGAYSITLTVTDNEEGTDSITKIIQVGASQATPTQVLPPIANFSYLPAAPTTGDTVRFNATLSTDPDGRITSFAWDFDADGVTDSTAAIVDQSFPTSGTYEVTLIVTDDTGATDQLTQEVVVAPEGGTSQPSATQPPIAAFSYDPIEPQSGSRVVFNGTLSSDPDGEIASFAWDFDEDGGIDSTAAISEFTFASGTYNVSLTVTDDDGNSDTLTQSVPVQAISQVQPPTSILPPVANFEYSPTQPLSGQPVSFNGLLSMDSDGDIVSYAWDFENDGVVDAQDAFVSHTFAIPGTYDVALTVFDNGGNSDKFIRSILVDAASSTSRPPTTSFQPPIASFSYMPEQPMAGELVLFDATDSWDPDGEILAYSWDFNNDGSPDAETASAEHIFPEPGSFTVSLTVTDNAGASDTLSISIDAQ
jgi:PKD repeat protein